MRKLKAKITFVGKTNILMAQANACFACRLDFEVLKTFGLNWPCFIKAPLRDAVKREQTPALAMCQVCVGIMSDKEFESLSEMVEHITAWRPPSEYGAPKSPTTDNLIAAWELMAQPNAPKMAPIGIVKNTAKPPSIPQPLRITEAEAKPVVEILGATEGLELPLDPPHESDSIKALEALLGSISDAK